MDKSAVQPFNLPSYRQLQVSFDVDTHALWCYFDPSPRPTFNRDLLADILGLQSSVAKHLAGQTPGAEDIRYFVAASAEPSVFNLGGDLALFAKLIGAQDHEGLRAYGKACVDAVYQNATSLGAPGLTTISLVQGAALGGGFEAALSSNVLIAERSAQMGFPEIMFNLFPGMGAYNLLMRRLSPAHAERLLHSGAQLSAEELHGMGVVDVLADDGAGVTVARQFIRQHARVRNGHLALRHVQERLRPLSYQDLIDIVDIWVDAALRVTPRDLRTMARLAGIQYRLPRSARLAVVKPPEGGEPTEQDAWKAPDDPIALASS